MKEWKVKKKWKWTQKGKEIKKMWKNNQSRTKSEVSKEWPGPFSEIALHHLYSKGVKHQSCYKNERKNIAEVVWSLIYCSVSAFSIFPII